MAGLLFQNIYYITNLIINMLNPSIYINLKEVNQNEAQKTIYIPFDMPDTDNRWLYTCI